MGGDGTLVNLMLVGILSDTHDNVPKTRDAVKRLNEEGVACVLHAGDFIAPFIIDTLKDLTAPMTGVFGNNDGDRILLEEKCAAYPHVKIRGNFARIKEGGVTIALIHGSDGELLEAFSECSSIDLLVYGHTHRAEIKRQGSTLIVNPGEVCGYLTGKSTIALVDTARRKAEIVEI